MNLKKLFYLVAMLFLASCTSYKNVPYMQEIEAVNRAVQQETPYDARIMPKDLLTITVNTSDPQASAPFNLTTQTPLNAASSNINTTSQAALQQYLSLIHI